MNRTRITLLLSLVAVLAALLALSGSTRAELLRRPLSQSGAPQVVSYQGQVTVDGIAYTGIGYFKFAIVNQAGDTTYWSNDGTSSGGSAPTAAVTRTVTAGLFDMLLGDTTLTNMTALPASAFDGTDRTLRVWFSADGSTFTQLSPDRRIAAVPYALQAEGAKTADTVDGQHASAFAVITHTHDSAYVDEGQVNSITSAMIVTGTIALDDIGQNGCASGQVIKWNGTAWACSSDTGATDHAALTGLVNDDHPQYFNLGQNEIVTGTPAFNGGTSGVSAPFSVDSTYTVTNLNADLLDGQHVSAFAAAGTVWSLTGNAGTTPATNFLGTTDNQSLVFKTNNTEWMRLDTSGRLGLGTTPSTGAPLTIRGTGASSEWLQLMDSSGVNQWHLNYSSGGLNFAETGVTDYRLFLEDGGDVGIGTDAPGAKLHVQQSSGSPTGYFENTGTGVYALRASTNSTTGGARTGYFLAAGTSGNTRAIYARNNSDSDNAAAGEFFAAGTTGMMTGVWAEISGTHSSSAGIYSRNRSASGYAGWFVGNTIMQGNLNVNGTLTKNAGSFKIDHPLDPANKTLSHSFVESPDMMNVYNGNVVLDKNGEAWVQLADWFEALNKDYRYQLTCIGGFAPVYIASEIKDNRFQIAGGQPGLKVSWQVTGIRRDPYAERYRIPVEENKPKEEQGTYRCPECYGLPNALGVNDARPPSDPDANNTR